MLLPTCISTVQNKSINILDIWIVMVSHECLEQNKSEGERWVGHLLGEPINNILVRSWVKRSSDTSGVSDNVHVKLYLYMLCSV